MRYDPGQFGSFDGLDNRRDVLALFKRLGDGLPDEVAGNLRAGFLRGLMDASTNGFAGRQVKVGPCSAAVAYRLFVVITGVLGVPVEAAARALEEAVRGRDQFLAGVLDEQGSLRPVQRAN